MLKRNTSGLEVHAQQKRESALERTEDAIARLIQQKRPVNFKTVSEESGVSRTWLYKEPDIKARINQLKNKHSSEPRSRQNATTNSDYQTIDTSSIDELKQKIKKLETENYALRNHLEVVYGMADPELADKVEALQRENEVLKERVRGSSDQQLLKRVQTLESENQKLRDENQQINAIKADLISARAKLDQRERSKPSSKPKLVVLEDSRRETTGNDLNLDDIQTHLQKIGVRLSKKLNELIESLEKAKVKNAVLAVEEYLNSGKQVKSKSGLLRKALKEG